MSFRATVIASSVAAEKRCVNELTQALGSQSLKLEAYSDSRRIGQFVFVDGDLPSLDQALASIDRKGRAVFLIVSENSPLPTALLDGRVDDVLVHPFRTLEVLSKIRQYDQIRLWDEVTELNASFSGLVARMKDDVALAERLQKRRLPTRFPQVKGMQVACRYLAGMRSGGDFFDVADSKEGSHLSIILSDSSSYGLASAVLSTLMSVAMKLSGEEARSSRDTVMRIYDDLAAVLSEKDKLSLFYGVLSRRDLRLRYLNLGTSSAFHCPEGEQFRMLPSQGQPITRDAGLPGSTEEEVALKPNDRFALISDGFVETLGGAQEACRLLDEFRAKSSVDSLNEIVYRVKKEFAEPDDMPEQDCTAVVFDVDSKVLRLA